MRKLIFVSVLTLLIGSTLALAGDEITVEGKIACAKCTLKVEGAEACQSVLVVKKGEKMKQFYIVENEVAEEYGHVCQGEKGAVVTGTVEEKDGKLWITATKMAVPKEA
jgi:hypothetical protein